MVAIIYGITYLNEGKLDEEGVTIATVQNIMGMPRTCCLQHDNLQAWHKPGQLSRSDTNCSFVVCLYLPPFL